jgi:hypothetical protein
LARSSAASVASFNSVSAELIAYAPRAGSKQKNRPKAAGVGLAGQTIGIFDAERGLIDKNEDIRKSG